MSFYYHTISFGNVEDIILVLVLICNLIILIKINLNKTEKWQDIWTWYITLYSHYCFIKYKNITKIIEMNIKIIK